MLFGPCRGYSISLRAATRDTVRALVYGDLKSCFAFAAGFPSAISGRRWEIRQTPSAKLEARAKDPTATPAAVCTVHALAEGMEAVPLPWSHYVRLLSLKNPYGRTFYETEALRGGCSVRQPTARRHRPQRKAHAQAARRLDQE
jgi:hypothetical protein